MKSYTLKLYKTNGNVEIVRTRKKKRFLKIIRTINSQNGIKKAYLKVSYGKKQCSSGCNCDFYNDGYYYNKEELMSVFTYFDGEK